jgi:hypothetical protein
MAGRCEVSEDGYEEQILIPEEKRDLAAKEGISTENGQKVTLHWQVIHYRKSTNPPATANSCPVSN